MRTLRLAGLLVLSLAISGCAGVSERMRMARADEAMCKHCNCLMPARVDPQAACPVCDCQRKAHQCARGQ